MGILAYRAGDYGRAVDVITECLEKAPLFFGARLVLVDSFFELGRVTDAEREAGKILEQDPGNVMGRCASARLLLAAGKEREARSRVEEIPREHRSNFRVRLVEALLLAREGRREDALHAMDEAVEKFADIALFAAVQVAEVYATLGRRDEALDWLDRAVRGGDERVEWFRRDPFLAGVRDDPRLGEIVSSVEARREP
jgi:tetratricopeptide (TPR) repeat protein